MRSEDVAEVFRARDAFDAHHVAAMLKAHGIPAAVVGDEFDGGSFGMMFAPERPCRVWVPRSLEERALAVLAEAREERPAESAWTCPSCGSEVDPGFDVCWNCAGPRSRDA